MRIDRFEFTKKFEKAFAKLTTGEQIRVRAALIKAAIDMTDPSLNKHELKGALAGITSFNAGGDLRILCRIFTDEETQIVAVLLVVGTHSQLYG